MPGVFPGPPGQVRHVHVPVHGLEWPFRAGGPAGATQGCCRRAYLFCRRSESCRGASFWADNSWPCRSESTNLLVRISWLRQRILQICTFTARFSSFSAQGLRPCLVMLCFAEHGIAKRSFARLCPPQRIYKMRAFRPSFGSFSELCMA